MLKGRHKGLSHLPFAAQGNYIFNVKKPLEHLKRFSFFLKFLPIFVFKHEMEKYYKKFPVRISETCGGLKNKTPHVKGLKLLNLVEKC